MSKENILNEIRKGCGKDYLSEDGDFELMCGKHIWESPGVIHEHRLCEWCLHLYEFVEGDDFCVTNEVKNE